MALPLPMQLPGGPELLVLLLIFVLLFGVPVALLVGAYLFIKRRGDDRVAALEARIDELEDELAAERDDGDNR